MSFATNRSRTIRNDNPPEFGYGDRLKPSAPKLPIFNWTEEATAKFRELYAANHSHSRIAAELGITRNASIGKAHRLGLEKRARTPRARPWVSAGVSERTWQRRQHAANPRPFKLDVEAFQQAIAEPSRKKFVLKGGLVQEAKYCDGLTDLTLDTAANPVTLPDLENHHCRWPCSGEGLSTLFCGDPSADVINGRPYCARHDDIAHGDSRRRSDARKSLPDPHLPLRFVGRGGVAA